MQIIWLTDIHLDFVSKNSHISLLDSIVEQASLYSGKSCMVITGDIGNSKCTYDFMLEWRKFADLNNLGFYFVLGNHDYYDSQIKTEREKYLNSVLKDNWLVSCKPVKLTEVDYLIGHDGWYDGGYANWFKSKVDMNDYYCIFEISKNWYSKEEIYNKINDLAEEASECVFDGACEAIKNGATTVYIATHIPPFRENSVYQNKISDDDWMPHFSSKKMGDKIKELSVLYPNVKFKVLCGHSHGEAKYVMNNITSYTGHAQYKYPKIAKCFVI